MVIDHYLCQKFSGVELTQQNSGKASVLCEATRLLREFLGQIECLKKEHASLLSKSNYVRPLTIFDRSRGGGRVGTCPLKFQMFCHPPPLTHTKDKKKKKKIPIN